MKTLGINRILGMCAVAMLFAGCFKSVSYDTTCILRPYTQLYGKDTAASLSGVVAYAFAVDSSTWRVASYEDAVAGVLTAWNNSAQRITVPTATAVPYPAIDTIPSSVNWLQMQLDGPSMMIVVADTEHQLYAYRQQAFIENFSPYYLSINFRPRMETPKLADGGWVYVNDSYAPELILTPFIQTRTSGAESPVTGVDLYAYSVDTTQWRVASYADALHRTITSTTDPSQKRTVPDFEGIPDPDGVADGWVRIPSILTEQLMVVAVYTGNRIYAYSMQHLPSDSAFVKSRLTFRLWQEQYIDNKWHVVNEGFSPEEDDPTNQWRPGEL